MEEAFQFEEVNDLLSGDVLTGERVRLRDPAMEGIEDEEDLLDELDECSTDEERLSTLGHALKSMVVLGRWSVLQ
jgi:hypothetical protein